LSVVQLAAGRRRPAAVLRLAGAGWAVVIASVVVLGMIVCAIFAPLVAPHSPTAIDAIHVFAGSSSQHLLGTDDLGRDILSRLIYGARPSLAGPALVIVLSSIAGTALALIAGWWRGFMDASISRAMDILFAFPGLILAVVAAAVFGAGFVAPVLALSIAYTPVIARILRAAVIRERNLPYVEALQLQGASGVGISLRHILPNIAPLILVQSTVGFGYAMLDLATISFLGLGIQPPAADWGTMAANGQPSILNGDPQQAIYASLTVLIAVVAVNVIGERFARRFDIDAR
jgi:peptide/nickel transport system permease protein